MPAIVTDSKKINQKQEMEVIGREFEIEVGDGIHAQGTVVEEPTPEGRNVIEKDVNAKERPGNNGINKNVNVERGVTPEEQNVVKGANDISTEVEEQMVAEPAIAEPAIEELVVEKTKVEGYEVEVAVNGLTLDLSENKINTASKQGSIGERKGVSEQQYQQAIRDEICPEIGVYDKSRLIQNISTIEKANEDGIFMDAGTLLNIMQKNNIPLPQTKTNGQGMQNIVVRDGAEYTIYFTETAEKMMISSADMMAHRDDILNARNVEELKDKLAERGSVERGNDKSVENANSIQAMNQSGPAQGGMDIGSR